MNAPYIELADSNYKLYEYLLEIQKEILVLKAENDALEQAFVTLRQRLISKKR